MLKNMKKFTFFQYTTNFSMGKKHELFFNNKQDAQDGLMKLEDDIYHHNSHNMDPLGVGELVVGGEEQQHVAPDILFLASSWLQKNVQYIHNNIQYISK